MVRQEGEKVFNLQVIDKLRVEGGEEEKFDSPVRTHSLLKQMF